MLLLDRQTQKNYKSYLPNPEKIDPDSTAVHEMAKEYGESGIPEKVQSIFGSIPEESREIISYAFRSHVTKERPLTILRSALDIGVDVENARTAAALTDILWNTSILIDDIIDGDVESGGQASAWAKFGKKEVGISIGHTLIAGMRASRCTFGIRGAKVYMTSARALRSVTSARRYSLDTSEETLLTNYDDRSHFVTTMPMELLALGEDEETANRLATTGRALQVMNRAGQVVNDIQDYAAKSELRQDDLSDVRSGTICLPIVHAWSQFSADQRQHFLNFFGKKYLSSEDKKSIRELYDSVDLTKTMCHKAKDIYAQALDIYVSTGQSTDNQQWVVRWIDYKLQQLNDMNEDGIRRNRIYAIGEHAVNVAL